MEENETPQVPAEGIIEETPEIVLPSDEVKFEMPEKFAGKSAEEIAKSYLELEAMKNEPPKEEEPSKEPTDDEPPKDDATTTADLIEEYASRGTDLTEEDYKTLEEKGYSRKQVDIYKAGVEAQNAAAAAATMEKAGTTPDEIGNAAEWARANWSEERVTQFNEAITTASEAIQIQMLQMLTEQYRAVGVQQPSTDPVHSTSKPAPKSEGYQSMEQLIADQSDPRYDTRSFKFDPAYYAAVRAKAGKSNF